MITPFDDSDKVDFKAVEKLVNHLIQNGTSAIVVSGTTGESPTLDSSEKKELLKSVLETAGNRAKVIMGTGYNDTRKSVEASKEAEKLGAHGLLVVAPYYNKPSQAGLLAHFGEVAGSTSLPIVIYNIPGRTGINITSETMIKLAEKHKNIHALKDSTGSVDQTGEIAGVARKDFRIYSGDDYLTLPFLSVGAAGVVSVASHIVGSQIKEMCDAFFNGNADKARELHYKYLPLFKALFAAPNPTCTKYALSKMGLCKENLRLPLVPLDAQQKAALDKVIEQLAPSASAV
ncbi:MAG: 4-hydroxy-tetrahydrodipicolinate synthase [Candidatus Melainabacteria bacterium]|nr:4-hydroxy-tetrahydrodipicolinate synthase [Candidatus Melainabacteria bacterium]